MLPQKVIKSERIFCGRIIDLLVEEIRDNGGETRRREIVSHPGGAVIVPVLDNGNILFVSQFRYPAKKYIFELPAGKLDANEDPLVCAKRELREETGYEASTLEKLTSFYTTPGFCNEILHCYLATRLKKSTQGQSLEEGEHTITLHEIPMKRAIEMIESGEIVDGKSIIGILLTDKKLKNLNTDN